MGVGLGNSGVQFSNININFNFGETGGIKGSSPKDILSQINNLFGSEITGSSNDDVFTNYLKGSSDGDSIWAGNGGCCQPPDIDDSASPAGSLKTEGSKITTPGGYTIEMTGQFDWKITGPDGKETKIWGDPHVAEGDGGKWDFKKDSTFVLGDGTKINVTTVPYGNGATVTGKLEVISGNDRVEVSDIDKGVGTIGKVTQDGFAHANSFQGDVFVMGTETDDWSKGGKEVIGSNDQGDTQILGDDLATADPRTPKDISKFTTEDWTKLFNTESTKWLNSIMKSFNGASNTNTSTQNRLGANPYAGNSRPSWEGGSSYNRGSHRSTLTQNYRNMANMFNTLAKLSSLNDSFNALRNRTQNLRF